MCPHNTGPIFTKMTLVAYHSSRRKHAAFRKSSFVRALQQTYGGRNCYAVVRQLAKNLHHEYRVSSPPFAPHEFAKLLSLPVFEADIEAEGVFVNGTVPGGYENGGAGGAVTSMREGLYRDHPCLGPHVLLRKIHKSECLISALHRRNFTLAHEIGHYVLRREVSNILETFRADDPAEETLCNLFAEELLMPRDQIAKDLGRYGIGPAALLLLRDQYDVSLQALLCRVSKIFREKVVNVLWAKSDSRVPVITWSSPPQYRRAILCNTGSTPIESAFNLPELQAGKCEVLLDGQRSRWNVAALRISGSNKVLSVLFGSMDGLARYVPVDLGLVCNGAQMGLDFAADQSTASPVRPLPRKCVHAESFPEIALAL
jgi:hypothetical protein